jgi:hypothetical protein
MKSEDCYRQAADEIESGRHDRALWAWAIAESGGDADKTRAFYIRRRVAALIASPRTAPMPAESELQRLRVELRRKLAFLQKKSLYSVLGVPADSSYAELAAAIERLTGAGQLVDAELRYAVDILGDADTREQFDRHLMEQLSHRPMASTGKDQVWEPSSATQMGAGLKALMAAFLVLGAGYLGLDYTKNKSERELRLKEAEIRSAEIRLKAEISDRVVDNRAIAMEASIAAQEKAAEMRERQQIEARMREDKSRLDNAYRQEQQQAQAEQRRQQMEQKQFEAEARRRDSETASRTRSIRQQAIQDAMARGNVNEAQRLRNLQY